MKDVPDSEVAMGRWPVPAEEGMEQRPFPSLEVPEGESPPATADSPKEALPERPNQAQEKNISENGLPAGENDSIMKTAQDQLIHNVSDNSAGTSEILDRVRLVIRVSENSWFNLQIDNSREMDFIMPAGASKTILAQGEIRMTVGNQRATHLILNGKILALPESPDNVVRNLIVNAEQVE